MIIQIGSLDNPRDALALLLEPVLRRLSIGTKVRKGRCLLTLKRRKPIN
tara:strand:+ start:1656 stop:1802 length:147 start_codon:yes stop_codon:yes gene_type:complete